MILTQSEAATRRCQEGFGPGPMSSDGNTHIAMASYGGAYAVATSPSCCIAGRCMAWRWSGRTIDGEFTGYCGKAGAAVTRPQGGSHE